MQHCRIGILWHMTTLGRGLHGYALAMCHLRYNSWCPQADNQANLYGGERTNVSTDMAIRWYLANGASAGKLNMGANLSFYQ